jgi:hypothetical protein
VSSRLFSSVVVREQRKTFTTAISMSQDFFLVLRDYSLAPYNFLSLGRLRHYQYSLEEKCPSTMTRTFGRCWRPSFYHDFGRFRGRLKNFFSRFWGPLLPRIRENHGRWSSGAWSMSIFQFLFWFLTLTYLFRLWGRDISVSSRLFFCSRDLAHVARCNTAPWVPDGSLFVRLFVPHDSWLLAFIFWNHSLW